MSLVDWILNLAGLFLWIDWRATFAATRPQPVISIASALRQTNRRRSRGWGSLLALAVLLTLRPFFYHSVGSAINWTPVSEVLALSLPWRSDTLDRMIAYSTLTFVSTLAYYYGCLLLVSAPRPQAPETDLFRGFVRGQLGLLGKLPTPLKVLLPLILAISAWPAARPLLTWLGMMPAPPKAEILWIQAICLGMTAVLTLKWFFIVLFLLYSLNSYVFLGTHSFWSFIAELGGTLLKPLAFLRLNKIDLAPLVAIVLMLVLSELVIQPFLLRLFERTLA